MKNKAKPEGCMALGYMYDEELNFTTKYLTLYPHTTCCIWDVNEDVDVGHVLIRSGKLKNLSYIEVQIIHKHVLSNSITTKELHKYTCANQTMVKFMLGGVFPQFK